MLTAMAAAALGGYVLCGINDTRRGAALAKDIARADCQMLLTEPGHRALLDGLDLPGVRIVDVSSEEWSQLLASAGPLVPHREVVPTDTLMMIFTSGTSGEPKAVQITHLTVIFAGANLIDRFTVDGSGVCYLSMPLFHSNALLAGWRRRRRFGFGDGAGHLLGVTPAVRSTPLRRHLHELRRQAVGLRVGHARSSPTTRTTRCASHSATRQAIATSRNSAGVSTARCGTASAPAKARSSSPAKTAAHPARSAAASPASASTTPTPSPNARWPRSTTTVH